MSTQPGSSFIEQKVFASDGNAQAWFGSAVAISGDYALIGAKNATVDGGQAHGAVYVYKRSQGTWVQTQKLLASDGAAGDQFGASISVSGNDAIIASPFARVDGETWRGAAYAFSLVNGSWVQAQKIVAKGGLPFDTFGTTVRVGAQWAVVSAGGAQRGATYIPFRVYVFERATGFLDTWIQKQVIDGPNPADVTSAFGNSIAVSGSTLMIGARASTLPGQPGQGLVYVYTLRNGNWARTLQLAASDGAARDNFGQSVTLQDDMALIGAPGVAYSSGPSQGAVYQFRRVDKGWKQTQKFTPDDGVGASLFGASLSLYKQAALIGAYAVNNYHGDAYLYQLKGTTWKQARKFVASDGESGDVFGYYTALSAQTALVSAYGSDVNGDFGQGSAYFYDLSATVPGAAPKSS